MKKIALGFMTLCLTIGLTATAYAHCGACGPDAKKGHHKTADKCKEKCANAKDVKACKAKCKDAAKKTKKKKKSGK